MKTVLLFFSIAVSCFGFGQKPAIFNAKGHAIAGYDPVSYFTKKMPVKGSGEFAAMWKGARWLFATEENMKMFEEKPEAYAPQYGGYCAYAVSRGYTAKSDPEAWKIVGGKLYLNYSRGVRSKWEEKMDEYIMKADANWPGLLTK